MWIWTFSYSFSLIFSIISYLWLIGKHLLLGKIEGRRRRRWQRLRWLGGLTDPVDLNLGTLQDGEGQGSLVCCSQWSQTWLRNWTTSCFTMLCCATFNDLSQWHSVFWTTDEEWLFTVPLISLACLSFQRTAFWFIFKCFLLIVSYMLVVLFSETGGSLPNYKIQFISACWLLYHKIPSETVTEACLIEPLTLSWAWPETTSSGLSQCLHQKVFISEQAMFAQENWHWIRVS